MLWSLILGAICGWLASKLMKSKGGLLRNLIMGLIGSAVGGFLFGQLGFAASGLIGRIIISVAGACLCIWIGKKVFK